MGTDGGVNGYATATLIMCLQTQKEQEQTFRLLVFGDLANY
jgi:hypothetical protein